MVLTSPLMLLGLLALPALAAVYWLRSRSRRTVVSSLAFWTDQRSPRQGGRILHRMQTPLSLFLGAVGDRRVGRRRGGARLAEKGRRPSAGGRAG